jgi:membrane protein DedA with SNARE-associated domain
MIQFFDPNSAWVAKLLSLLILPFAHEDLAIIVGGYIVVNHLMPAGVVAASIYGGMVASDFALYGIGAAARHVPWLRRWAVNDRVQNFADALKRNLFELVAFCRVVPGVVFIAFIACGWTRVPLARFTIASLIVSALYLPLVLYLVIVFGDALDDHAGLWAWPVLLIMLLVAGFVRYRVFMLDEARPVSGEAASASRAASTGVFAWMMRQVASGVTRLPKLQLAPRAAKWLSLR